MTISKGDKVRVKHVHEMCCGVVMQGNQSTVRTIIKDFDDVGMEQDPIVILEDQSVHRMCNLEKA